MPAGRLTLYSRDGCGLCEDMAAALARLRARASFELEIVDIDADPALQARYAGAIPVLAAGEREICRYHLDTVAVLAVLSAS